jgi:hypothetical protein
MNALSGEMKKELMYQTKLEEKHLHKITSQHPKKTEKLLTLREARLAC